MALDTALMQQLLEVFQAELSEQLQLIADGLLRLEKGIPDHERGEVLDGVFRAAHNIKGAARGVEVDSVVGISHGLESLFSAFKHGRLQPTAAAIDLSLESLDRMRDAMAAFKDERELGFDLPALLAKLQAALEAPPASTTAHQEPEDAAWSEAEGKVKEDQEPTPQDAPSGRETAPTMALASEVIRVSIGKLDHVAAQTEELQIVKIEIEDHLSTLRRLRDGLDTMKRILGKGFGDHTGGDNAARMEELERRLEAGREAIMEADNLSLSLHKEFRESTNHLMLVANSLQSGVRMMRLVPWANVLQPLARSVRDIARELGKRVNYTVIGDEVEVDRLVLEGVKAPLTHIVRNAVDHGIEMPADRRALGKPEEGQLTITVQAEGSQIAVRVEDDGAGINLDVIRETALRKKIVTALELESMAPSEVMDLIFRPGFSSKEIITDISGRGVGLDVVRANLRRLKGNVRLETVDGGGTVITLQVPLTLVTDRGLLVRASGSTFVIPITAVERIMELSADEVQDVEASQVILLQERPLPLKELGVVLGRPQRNTPPGVKIPVVILSKGWEMVAFMVDEVLEEREIVVKPFAPPLVYVRNVIGGTLTGSGDVITVLNPGELVDSALYSSSTGRLFESDAGAEQKRQRILVVDDSITTRTLERSILESEGYQVEVAVDGGQAWEVLQESQFDLVITDIEMPKLDGFGLTDRIKQSEQYQAIPVVVVTSLATEADKQRGIEVGADAYIVKGKFETRVLLEVVRQLV